MGKRPQLDLGEITFGRVVSSDSSGGGGSPYVNITICKWGNGHNWIWAKLPLVELSQVTAPGGITFN